MQDIDGSCPADLEPYARAHRLQMQEQDAQMYAMGLYNKIAFEVCLAHFGAGLSGKKSGAEYIKEPFMRAGERKGPLTEEECQREVDLFFAREEARRARWRRNRSREAGKEGAGKC